jgi:hypothetical protein
LPVSKRHSAGHPGHQGDIRLGFVKRRREPILCPLWAL